MFNFICLTLLLPDTRGVAKYARAYIRRYTHTRTHKQKQKEKEPKKEGKKREVDGFRGVGERGY